MSLWVSGKLDFVWSALNSTLLEDVPFQLSNHSYNCKYISYEMPFENISVHIDSERHEEQKKANNIQD